MIDINLDKDGRLGARCIGYEGGHFTVVQTIHQFIIADSKQLL